MEAIVAGDCTVWLSAFSEQAPGVDCCSITQIEEAQFSITVDARDPADVLN